MPELLLYSLSRIAVRTYARLMLELDVHWNAPLP
jgi:hypothetical protein